MVTNDKDYLCTQASYRLNLRGPSIVVQTTCSTSLVAIAHGVREPARRPLRHGAGRRRHRRVPQRGGYFYTAGIDPLPRRHCRPFDANAQGTIVGSGVGLVVLKRLEDAIARRRHHPRRHPRQRDSTTTATTRSATPRRAPRPGRGDPAAHAMRRRLAGVIGYVEAHGTGTILGDPIEVAALTEVFQPAPPAAGFCGIGSVKSNFGHLSCAAGVAGLIKTVLALEHGAIPPTVHYTSAESGNRFRAEPVLCHDVAAAVGAKRHAAARRRELVRRRRHQRPRRRGGGAGERPPTAAADRISCSTLSATKRGGARRGDRAARRPTSQRTGARPGRRRLHTAGRPPRLRASAAVVVGGDDRRRAIDSRCRAGSRTGGDAAAARPVVFMFPGQGAQYPGMAGRPLPEASRSCAAPSIAARAS